MTDALGTPPTPCTDALRTSPTVLLGHRPDALSTPSGLQTPAAPGTLKMYSVHRRGGKMVARALDADDVKLARGRFKMSQSQFADMLGVGKRVVAAWESGEKICSGSPAAYIQHLWLEEQITPGVVARAYEGGKKIKAEKGYQMPIGTATLKRRISALGRQNATEDEEIPC
jgi:DNA-binding transcriptional regulator YiaG